MNKIASKKEVRKLLDQLKQSLDPLNSNYNFEFRDSTHSFFNKHGVFKYEIKNQIKKFTIKNYLEGPKKDYGNYPGEVWMFKFNFNNLRIYIKFRKFKKYFFCFRLHVDDGSKKCPYKNECLEKNSEKEG
ncbi:MAG: hypothetical protein AWU54_397 [Candidatus Frackibacter sp. T328-2]|nr:MAG: hypothetical protein AWU54_397 [Candidatus Frackibacter sp. T328-2]